MTTKNKNSEFDRIIVEAFIGLSIFILISSKTIWKGIKETKKKEIIPLLLITSMATFSIVHFQWHYKLLHYLAPEFF